ncbi:MAG: UDP-N-acetylmuramate dehydrogenase [Planctomycetota bacterium]|nr:UDP-N-acetylmuramate dehydrogenase [Planctomycetota bacterium]
MSLIDGFEHIARENESLAAYTRLKLGGPAEYFAEPTTEQELVELVKRFSQEQQPIRLIGGGSNVIIGREGVSGLVLHLAAPVFCELSVDQDMITTGGGTKLAHFVSTAVREGFAGPEQLVGIPGTVGGALHCNSGAHGEDIGTWVESAEVLTRSGERLTRSGDSLAFSYRQSSLDELVILRATFRFEKESPETLTKQMQKMWIVRRSTQPFSQENAVYVFKDHGGESASELIERCGLKGLKVGQVQVSDLDANIFLANPGATSEEVLELIERVKSRVYETLSVELETAVRIW